MKLSKYLLILFSLLFWSCTNGETKKEAKQDQEAAKVTIQEVEEGIRANIAQKVKDGNGYFNFKKDTTVLNLKLVRVHTEYLSVLGPNKFFACVDLATAEGNVYDVDFFMEGTADSMQVIRTDVHKINGKPFYTWKQQVDKTWITVPVKQSSNKLLGVIEASDHFTFTYELTFPVISETAEVWIPIVAGDNFQEIIEMNIDFPTDYSVAEDLTYGNSILHATIGKEQSGQTATITYEVIRQEKSAYEGTMDSAKHLGAEAFLPINKRFVTISEQVFQEKQATTPLTKARALYDYIIDNLRYAKQGKYGTGDAEYACDAKSGNCTEFHSFFISLARSSGIPARFAVGAAIPSERNEGGVNGYHCWAEFYAEGKWWPIDISEANKYSALATYYFGHHPANRIEFSKGRNIEPMRIPRSGAINFLAYPVFEENGEVKKIKTAFHFERKAAYSM